MVSKNIEIIVILLAILAGIAAFILMLFYCTRHQKRIQDDSLRHGHDNHSAHESHQRYFGAVGWFQRYRTTLKEIRREDGRCEEHLRRNIGSSYAKSSSSGPCTKSLLT